MIMTRPVEPYTPTEEEKSQALGDIFYEIQQLVASFQMLSEEAGQNRNKQNAFLESALIHVRVLSDFFERKDRSGRNQSNDDVLSSDFGLQSRDLGIDTQYRERLNKDLMHLSFSRYERRPPGEREWPLSVLVPPLLNRAIEFIDLLGEEQLGRGLGASASQWQQLRLKLVELRT